MSLAEINEATFAVTMNSTISQVEMAADLMGVCPSVLLRRLLRA